MKKVSVIYWSNGGNVEVLANSIAQGAKEAGAHVVIKHVSEADVDDVTKVDAVAMGSPSMDNNRIEQEEMEPFVNKFKLLPNENKSLVLFGSYGWDNGEFLVGWKDRMTDYGFNVVGELSVKESPTEEEINKAKELGKLLAR